jgi:tetratricopeptide (TPR) repeat protein
MAYTDRYGLPVTTASAAAAQRFQDGMDGLLSYGAGADDAFAQALQADQRFALASAGLAMLAAVRGDAATARAATERARATVDGATRRERQHVEAVSALLGGDTTRGLALVEEHVAEFPRDAMLVNQASSAIGFGGARDREQQRMAFLERLASAYGDDWWFESALAFTYHEVGRFEESRRLSERSLRQYPGNAHAAHNIAHVHFETVDIDAGADFLATWLAGYDARAPFHCHLAWHQAMFELHRGHPARALEIVQRDIVASTNPRLAAIDGAALLWRLRLDAARGGAPGPDETAVLPTWRSLAALAERVSRPGFLFGEIHAALAHASCGDTAAVSRLLDGLRALDARGHPIAGSLAVPLVEGIAAFVGGDHATALARLEPVDGEVHRIGGSHAQWELFEETMVASYLALGRHDDALRLIRRRLARRASPRDLQWLARAQAATTAPGSSAPIAAA